MPKKFSLFMMLFRLASKHKTLGYIAALAGAVYYFGGISNFSNLLSRFEQPLPSVVSSLFNKSKSTEQTSYEISDVENFLIQGTRKGVSEYLLYRKAYIASYNKDTRQPNWVAWCLTKDHAEGSVPRQQQFIEDTDVPHPRPTLEDYRHSGYDRGHMCPAGDNKWDKQAMYESFYLTNMCPQNSSLNSGLWNRFEQDCRNWAMRLGEIYICCGPLFLKQQHQSIGLNRVLVPEAFFKIVLCPSEKQGFGIICRNTDGLSKKDLYFNSIDEVERITGIDFFPALPDDIEQEIEEKSDEGFWKHQANITQKMQQL